METAGDDPPALPETAQSGSESVSLTLPDALRLGLAYQQDGYLANAEAIWRRILIARPDEPSANHYLGLLLHHTDRSEEAAGYLAKSRALAPDDPHMLVNFGLIALEQNDLEGALGAFQKAIEADRNLADAHANLGLVWRRKGNPEEAEAAYRRALEADADHGPALLNLANLCLATGRAEAALDCAQRAAGARLQQRDASLRLVGHALTALGRHADAKTHYRRWLEAEPHNPFANHYAGALEDTPPERCSDGYVSALFDEMAANFDNHLGALDYGGPSLMAHMLEVCERTDAAHGKPQRPCVILDAGCGTGLCAPILRPRASRLVGVDLSGKMLRRANALKVYDQLVQGELTAYLTAHPDSFDLIVAADVFIYFGALAAPLRAAAKALRSGGRLIATCEASEAASEFELLHSGRYAHGRAYLEDALSRAGFALEAIEACTLRKEFAMDVGGWLFAARV